MERKRASNLGSVTGGRIEQGTKSVLRLDLLRLNQSGGVRKKSGGGRVTADHSEPGELLERAVERDQGGRARIVGNDR